MSEQEAIARAREREAEIVRIRAAKKLQAALRNKKIGQNYQNQLNLNKLMQKQQHNKKKWQDKQQNRIQINKTKNILKVVKMNIEE